jgi:hypothetical protein
MKDKFTLFVVDSVDLAAFLGAGFWAATDQGSDRDPTFGQGAAGHSKRFAANFADQASSKFFKDFAYPAILSEDPRYASAAIPSSVESLASLCSRSLARMSRITSALHKLEATWFGRTAQEHFLEFEQSGGRGWGGIRKTKRIHYLICRLLPGASRCQG